MYFNGLSLCLYDIRAVIVEDSFGIFFCLEVWVDAIKELLCQEYLNLALVSEILPRNSLQQLLSLSGSVAQPDVESCSEELLRQHSYAIKNQLVASRAPY